MSVKEIFELTGLLVFKGAIATDAVASWRIAYDNLSNPDRTPEYNPVAVNEAALQPVLHLIATHPVILAAVTEIFGPDIALYNQRFIVKDKHARDPVFLHQDTPYHIGWPQKASAFVALSNVTAENGGLIFYPSTHKLGYLGDAGEINRELVRGEGVGIELSQGDFVIMHSALWHESGANTNGIDRILADIIYQPASDPSGIELLQGEWKTTAPRIPLSLRDKLLVRSRASRLRDLQTEIDERKEKE